MAGIFNGSARGGTRGGRSEFSWDNVKADQSREYYLGHSVKAVTGRWAKGKDVLWYTRDKEEGEDADARRKNEMAMVKQREQDLMMEALGMKPKAPKHETRQHQALAQEDMKKLLGKDQDEDYQNHAGPSGAGEGDRIRGLGYNASRTTGAVQSGLDQERLEGVGMRSGRDMPPRALPAPPAGEGHRQEELKKYKEDKKTTKRDKKESRKEKKLSSSSRKDSKKEKRRRRRSRSHSRETSSSSPERQRRGRERTDRGDRGDERVVYNDDSRDRKDRRSRRRSRNRSPVERTERRRRSRSPSRERQRH